MLLLVPPPLLLTLLLLCRCMQAALDLMLRWLGR
jgi:hypothetical protein